ncbi:MAG: hypothetical protein RBS33_13460, partial [Lentimicrobium sp.]|nr:hypothetical protein [Lentimicrobium sp.]
PPFRQDLQDLQILKLFLTGKLRIPPEAGTHRLNDSTNQQINLLLDRIYKISVKANVDCGSQI